MSNAAVSQPPAVSTRSALRPAPLPTQISSCALLIRAFPGPAFPSVLSHQASSAVLQAFGRTKVLALSPSLRTSGSPQLSAEQKPPEHRPQGLPREAPWENKNGALE